MKGETSQVARTTKIKRGLLKMSLNSTYLYALLNALTNVSLYLPPPPLSGRFLFVYLSILSLYSSIIAAEAAVAVNIDAIHP